MRGMRGMRLVVRRRWVPETARGASAQGKYGQGPRVLLAMLGAAEKRAEPQKTHRGVSLRVPGEPLQLLLGVVQFTRQPANPPANGARPGAGGVVEGREQKREQRNRKTARDRETEGREIIPLRYVHGYVQVERKPEETPRTEAPPTAALLMPHLPG